MISDTNCASSYDINNKKNFGLLAQQLEEIGLNELVSKNNNYKSVNYIQLFPFIIKYVQDLKNEINELRCMILQLQILVKKSKLVEGMG